MNPKYHKLIPFAASYLTLCLLFLLFYHPAWAAVPAQVAQQSQDEGQEYIVQSGDSLYKISGQFYGRPNAYRVIVEATNAKAATDPRFRPITDPSRIRAGQRLWIPNNPDLPIMAQSSTPVAQPPTRTTTVPATMTPSVRFVSPANGTTVSPTVPIVMAAAGLVVEPAGEIHEGAGHFHILVDTDFVPAGEVIITDEQHLHFGKGQLTTTLELEPGEHVLRLQFANGAHIALEGEQYQDTITVTVAGTSSAPGVRFVTPIDGATVPPTVTVVMTATGLTIEPAGEIHEDAGHFHILIDTDFVPAGEVIITDEQHLHFGKAQTQATLALTPGRHTLRLQFANGAHIALEGEQYQDEIAVTVE
jgi:hypothetical protein